jgi:hypothetical protein
MTLIQKLNNYFSDDNDINDAIAYLTTKIVVPAHIKSPSRFITKFKHFVVKEGKLIYNPKEITIKDSQLTTQKGSFNLEVVPKANINKVLEDEFNDSKVIGKGIRNFYKYIISKYINIKRSDIEEFLKSQEEYQLSRPITHRTNKPIISMFPNQLWSIDLIDLNNYVNYNYQNKYIITVVDIFSRKVWLEKTKEKSAETIKKGFEKVCNRAGVMPVALISDNGKEFLGEFGDFCKDNDIKQRFTRSYTPQANGVVERKNREIRKLIKTLMIKNNTLKWMGFLDDIEYNLNRTYNGAIKATPEEIWTDTKEPLDNTIRTLPKAILKNANQPLATKYRQILAQDNVIKRAKRAIEKFKETDDFEVGDRVRVKMSSIFNNVRALLKSKDAKQIVVAYTPQIFAVAKVIKPRKTTLERNQYILANSNGFGLSIGKQNTLKRFYASELMKVPDDYVQDPNNTMSMERALQLNNVDTNENDVKV